MAAQAVERDTLPHVVEAGEGDRIRVRREALGITKQALAAKAGIDRGRLSEIERGANARPTTIAVIDRALAELEEEMSGPYDSEHTVTFRMSGNFGVDVTVQGPVENLSELEESVGRLLQRMRNGDPK